MSVIYIYVSLSSGADNPVGVPVLVHFQRDHQFPPHPWLPQGKQKLNGRTISSSIPSSSMVAER